MLLFDFRCYCRYGHRRLWDDVWTWDIDHTRGAHVFRLLFGQWIGRSYDTLSALGLSAIVILLDNPYLLWYAGFLLSFCSGAWNCGCGTDTDQNKKAVLYFFGELFW